MRAAPEDAAKSPSRLTVKELQKRLKQQGLDTTGVKAVLVARLRDQLDSVQTEKQDDAQGADDTTVGEATDVQQTEPDGSTAKLAAADDEKHAGTLQPRRPADARGSDEQTNVDARLKRDAPDPALSTEQQSQANEPEETATCSLRIDNFRRPFTLNAVKALVQELGQFVDGGFWMDAIKTHCYVTYENSESARKTCDALDGKVWPPEGGIALKAALSEHTAQEIASGKSQKPNPLKRKASSIAHSPRGTNTRAGRAFTIDEFFRKTETKPVLYYLPLTEDQIKQRKERQRHATQRQNTTNSNRGIRS